jgi:hypothetical protein
MPRVYHPSPINIAEATVSGCTEALLASAEACNVALAAARAANTNLSPVNRRELHRVKSAYRMHTGRVHHGRQARRGRRHRGSPAQGPA